MKNKIVLISLYVMFAAFTVFASGESENNAAAGQVTEFADIQPSAADAFMRGMVSWDSQELAMSYFVRATEIDPSYAAAWYRIGELQKGWGDEAAAARAFERAVQAEPGFTLARYSLIDLYRYNDTTKAQAEEQIAIILNYDPDDPHGLWYSAQLLAEKGELSQARDVYIHAIDSARSRGEESLSNDLSFYLADIYKNLNQSGDALRLYNDIVQENPANAHATVELAWLLFDAGDSAQALSVLENHSHDSWDYYYVREELAHMLLELGQADRAAEIAREVLDEQPDRNAARATFAETLMQGGEYAPALEQLQIVLEKDQYNPWVWTMTGYALLETSDVNGAYNAFTRAREQWHEGVDAILGLAETEELRQNWPAAIRLLQEGLDKVGSDARLSLRLAVVMAHEGRQEDADALFARVQRDWQALDDGGKATVRAYFRRNPASMELLPSDFPLN